MPELRIRCPGQPDQDLPLEGQAVTIGRGEDCDAWIAEKKASRQHLKVQPLPGGGWIAEDPGSSNGTWLGEQRVMRHLLQDGDVLRIGDTTIEFAAGVPAAATGPAVVMSGTLDLKPVSQDDPAPVEVDDPEAVEPARESSSISDVPVSTGRRGGGGVGSMALGAIVVGIIALIGVEMFLGDVADKARSERTERREVLRILSEVRELSHDQFADEVAEFRDRFPTSQHLPTLEDHLKYVEERDIHEELVKEQLAVLMAWPEGVQPSEMAFRLQALGRQLPGDETFQNEIQTALGSLASRRVKADAEALDRLDHDVALALAADDPARAGRLLKAFRHANPGLGSATLDELVGVSARIDRKRRAVFDKAWATADDANTPAEARAALAKAWPGLAGTDEGNRIGRRLRDLGRSVAPTAPSGTDRPDVKDGQPTEAPDLPPGVADDVLALYDRAETLLAARSWVAGRKLLAEAVEKVARGRLKNEWTQLLADTDRVIALTGVLGERAQKDKKPRAKLADGSRVTIVAADPSSVTLQPKSGEPKKRLWSQIEDDDILTLLTPSRPSTDDRIAVAIVAANLQDQMGIVEALLPIFEKGKELGEANRVVAQHLYGRETIPEGGYRAYKGKLVDQRGYEREVRQERIAEHKARADVLLANMAKQSPFKKLAKLQTMRAELDKRRSYALLAIFNEKHYPYPANKQQKPYRSVQAEIDARVAKVKEIWDDPYKVKIPLGGQIGKLLGEWDALIADLEGYGEDVRPLKKKMQPYRDYCTDESITIREFFTSAKEKALFEYNRWVMNDYNPARTEYATGAERQQVRVTNDYRTMLGYTAMVRPGPGDFNSIDQDNVIEVLDGGEVLKLVPLRAVRVDNRCAVAARDHSLDMAKRGFFSHFAPPNPATGTGRTSPHERMAVAGYSGYGSSENIANGATSPERAHWMWIHSSGHHRNILSNWSDLGSGQAGRLWTQNFGTGGGARPQIAEDTEIHYPERRRR